ncbi:MAG: glycosyltransferase family 2 protein [Deltaproteobacteria bacterium]|nr:glycosyltransferase family 2 protein [Deltaproteobacteria bacterium]
MSTMSENAVGSGAAQFSTEDERAGRSDGKPFVSLVVPAYNEAAIVEKNLAALCQYMATLADQCRWEIIFVNDGSADDTGKIADAFAKHSPHVRVLHHVTNFGAGQAFRFAFNQCRGDYIITLDLDLSYSPDHIERLLRKIRETRAKVVVASPYMVGGKLSNVPWLRRTLSVWANRFLSRAAKGHLSTLTSMVRAYDRRFLQSLDLKSTGLEINPEIIHKAMLLGAKIEEVPAHLDWGTQKKERAKQRSSINIRLLRHIVEILLSGFLFRPVMFFVLPGLGFFLLSLFANTWVLIHSYGHYQSLSQYGSMSVRASAAVAAAFAQAPHTFIIGGMTLMLSIQLISLGILALQGKSYFEEVFHLGTTIYKATREQTTRKDKD